MILKRIFDVLAISSSRLALVDGIQDVYHEVAKARFVKVLSKGLGNQGAGLVPIHLASNKYEERITSRGLRPCGFCCARVAWKNNAGMSLRRTASTRRGSISVLTASATFLVVGRGNAPSIKR